MTSIGGAKTGPGRRRVRWWHAGPVLAVALAMVATLALATGPSQPRSQKAADPKTQEALAILNRAEATIRTTAGRQEASSAAPSCPPPKLPLATSPGDPPGSGYGVPFLAEITGGKLLGGYDEYFANTGLYPWRSNVTNITGWVAGLLQVPSLAGVVQQSGIVFCTPGSPVCPTADTAKGCVQLVLGNLPGFPAITNVPAPGKTCSQTPFCISYVFTLASAGPATLSVIGETAAGALQLRGTTAAVTTAALINPNPALTQTCVNKATTITVGTEMPPLPSSGPPAPTSPNKDYRALQTTPQPLAGPLARSTATIVANDFAVPAFLPDAKTNCIPTGVAGTLNDALAGWSAKNPNVGTGMTNRYKGGPIAGQAGWNQFSATATIIQLDLPVGPPAGFNF